MQWDLNGNMTQFNSSATGETRRMCWDEENRLSVVKDPNYASHYIYDAGGERVWKITGPIERMSINGGLYVDQTMLDYKTLYASPYMVISDMEYTKHFYAESQRVTTKLGGGFSPSLVDAHSATLTPIVGSIQDIADGLWDYIYNNTECVDGDADYVSVDHVLPIVEDLFSSNNDESDLYFYHPDHLGSSSFISDVNGDVNQHLQYLPFGESFIDQQTNHNIRFTFSSKEKDSETGFGYFGARYYNSDVGVWLSVDPMSDERPGISPYNYCQWNPLVRIDMDGALDGWVKTEKDGNYIEDSRVNNQSDAETYYGKDAVYRENGYSYESKSGNKIVLGENGNYIENGVNKKAKDHNPINSVISGNSDKSFVGGMPSSLKDSLVFKGTKEVSKKGFEIISDEVVRQGKFNNSLRKPGVPLDDVKPLKVPKSLKIIGKYGGTAFTLYGAYDIREQWKNGEISMNTMIIEQVSNGISAIPAFGTGWSIGWYLGKNYGPSTWYGNDDYKWFK